MLKPPLLQHSRAHPIKEEGTALDLSLGSTRAILPGALREENFVRTFLTRWPLLHGKLVRWMSLEENEALRLEVAATN